jgi:predicted SAM-dependent methyltransferase
MDNRASEQTAPVEIFQKLHLGCGRRYIEGFYHIDVLDEDHVDRVVPIDDLSFIPDNCVELIYACSVLEHFSRHEYMGVLSEWRRVLKPAGILRLSVPSLEAALAIYMNHPDYRGDVTSIFGTLLGGQRNQYDYHKMVFDEALLTGSLVEAGFTDCRKWDWRSTDHAHVDDYSQAYLPHMDKENGRHMALNIEATKSEATRDRP